MKTLMLKLLKLYKKLFSPINYGVYCCRFTPSCADYSYEAIETHGAIKGSLLSAYRILRCNPLAKGGYDPIPVKKVSKEC